MTKEIKLRGKPRKARWISEGRRKLGLSGYDLGYMLGFSQTTIWKWESGVLKPTPEQTEAIKVALGL